jgi:tetratricopeptide (TPR) repeat protein
MSRVMLTTLLGGALLCPCWAAPAFGQITPDQVQIYEDIEIMGRILDRALNLPRYGSAGAPSFSGLGGLGGGFVGAGGGLAGMRGGGGLGGGQIGFGGGQVGFGGGNSFQGSQRVSYAAYPRSQGAYLKGYGVIFAAILPPQRDPRPAPAPTQAPPLTEWERLRKQLHGEPTGSPAPPRARHQEAALTDVVLEALAKNGHHFSHLGAQESLTVSIVFRQREPVSGAFVDELAAQETSWAWELPKLEGASSLEEQMAVPEEEGNGSGASQKETPQSDATGARPPTQESSAATREAALRALAQLGTRSTDQGSSPQDYELLGDLHAKQGQSQEALKAYRKAAEKTQPGQQSAAVYLKLAHLYLTAVHDPEQARTAMNQAREALAQAELAKTVTPAPAKAASPLPSRLTITVPKRLLDPAGTGKITMEEFKKEATVEYLPFAAAKPRGQTKPVKTKAGN